MANKINIFRGLLLALFIFSLSAKSFSFNPIENEKDAQDTLHIANSHAHEAHAAHGEEKFDAGKMILEHVADNHSWHLFGHISISLPVILKTAKGVEIFSSAHFGHAGSEEYKGELYTYALKEGSVVIVDSELGSVDEIATAAMIDLSITKNVAAMFISMFLMCFIFISTANAYKNNKGKAPKGIQSFIEPIIMFVRDDIARPNIGEKKYARFMPFLLTVFFFILINNYMGLIPFFPGGVNLTGSISVAMVLAGFTLVMTFIVANKNYWQHIFAMPGVPIPVLIILTPIEIIGLFLRPFVLMIRLFANITAGHIIALAFFSLIFIFGELNAGAGLGVSVLSLVFTVFMGALELLVAFLQAYVFTLLSSVYFGAAVEEAHGHGEGHAEAHH